MKIKLCGLMDMADVDAANEAKPDAIGFVFAPSKRQITISQAQKLAKALHPAILKTGVFVNAPIKEIERIVQYGILDQIQLHGQESFAYVKKLAKQVSCPLIKALRMDDQTMDALPAILERYRQAGISLFLLDHGTGGTGMRFDWTKLPDISYPYLLAGGICLENIEEALHTGAIGLDVSSGVETNGKKDRAKMIAMVSATHEMQNEKG